MNLATATPVEIDTRLADLYGQEARAARAVVGEVTALHYALDERPRWVNANRKTWPTTDEQAIALARAKAEGGVNMSAMYSGRPFTDPVARYDAAVAELARIRADATPLHAEYDRRPWSRFFTVKQRNGHIHDSMRCSTCNRNGSVTEFGWNPELSGLTEADAVAKLGPALCTVCFPSAPVEWTIGKPAPASCAGGRAVPGSHSRTGMRFYGECPTCHERGLVNADGTIRKHPPQTAGK